MASTTYTYAVSSDTYRPESFVMVPNDFISMPEPALGGQIRTFEVPGTRLISVITYGIQTAAERAEIAGWWAFAGMRRNRVRLGHLGVPIPRGTMRGNPLVKTAVSPGAESVVLKSMNGTLLRGDWIGLSDGMHVVGDTVTPNGSNEGTVPISPQIRTTVAADSAVVWDRPTSLFLCTQNPEIPFSGPGAQPSFSVRLVETW